MADTFITVTEAASGKKLDCEGPLSIGGQSVLRERVQLTGDGVAEKAVVKNTDVAPGSYALAVRVTDINFAVRDFRSSASLAAGVAVDLDGTTIAVGKTGKLLGVDVSSSVACKWVVKTRDGAVELTVAVLFTGGLAGMPNAPFRVPDKSFATLAGAGVDENFRVTVTNQDAENSGDAYATIYWDEV